MGWVVFVYLGGNLYIGGMASLSWATMQCSAYISLVLYIFIGLPVRDGINKMFSYFYNIIFVNQTQLILKCKKNYKGLH